MDVPPADFAKIQVSDFGDDELDLPYYLANFHRVANAIPLEGKLRGWITVSVWRGDRNQRTYNARVMESHLSLAYFHCTKRPWNPYYGHPAVRARLEAMLERWCHMQNPEGKFSEYGENRWSLAPTAFATKFMAETLRLLADGPPIDPDLHNRVIRAQRQAIRVTLTDRSFWQHGRNYSNQFGNVWAGGLAWLAMFPKDDEIRTLLLERMRAAATEFQSPAGYFYERGGADWGYNLGTHHSNLHMAWHYARGTEFAPLVLDETRRFYDWISWNAVLEPDGSGFTLNRAIETRQRLPWLTLLPDRPVRNLAGIPQAEQVELARAFLPNRDAETAARVRTRAMLEAEWPKQRGLTEGHYGSFSPYVFLHRSFVQWLPTVQQQAEAQAQLPFLRPGRMAHLRLDDRHAVQFLFVRRPHYYAAFNSGELLNASQRYGLGLLGAPGLGALAQSQTGSNDDFWGTKPAGAAPAYEARNLNARIRVDGKMITRKPGTHDLGAGELVVQYPLGEAGQKTIRFKDDGIQVRSELAGDFSETVPLLVRPEDHVRIEPGKVLLERGGRVMLTLESTPGVTVELLNNRGLVGPYRVTTVRMNAADRLAYAVVIKRD